MEQIDYLVIGGGLSAVYAVQAIRERAPTGSLVLVTNEPHPPYDRVPLSKGYLVGKVRRESLFPRKADFFEKQQIRIVTGRDAKFLDAPSKLVTLDDGTQFQYGRLLLATGGRPRKLSLPGSDLKGIHYLRTIEDSDAIKQEMTGAKKAVVVGGGFIGCELAAAFAGKGIDTTVVESAPSLLSLAFDPDTSKWVESYFAGNHVKVITKATVSEFVGANGRITGVKTDDGKVIPGDLVVVGVGIIPNTDLGERAGLEVDRGIVVNEFLETSIPGIFAAGDVARFFHPVFKHHIRVEHYDIAVRHGRLAGANMAGERRPFTEMPYFFSYLFDLTIKAYGDMSRRDSIVRRGELSSRGFLQFFFADGKLGAFLSMNRPIEEINVARQILSNRPSFEEMKTISDESVGLLSFVKSQTS